MTTIHSFPPIFTKNARILILGSIPGKISLAKEQYYAHKRNTFWKVMAALMEFDPASTYDCRVQYLQDNAIAVWDVLAMCTRESSLDSDIVESSIVPNDFSTLYNQLENLTHVYFNGAKAEQCYQRYVYPDLVQEHKRLPTTRLPSTSPAHAAINFQAKLAAWRVIVAQSSPSTWE